MTAKVRALVEDAGLSDLVDVRITWPADAPGNLARHRWRIEVRPKERPTVDASEIDPL